MKRVAIPLGFSLELADGWFDVTDDLETHAPFTLAREDGVGAFQFSLALFDGGAIPNATVEELRRLLESFGRERGLGMPADVRIFEGRTHCVGGSFRGEDFICAWYVTDGRSFVFASHTSASSAPEEVSECERMIRTLAFSEKEPNQSTTAQRASRVADR